MSSDSTKSDPLFGEKVRYFFLFFIPILIFCSLTFFGLFRREYIEILDGIGDEEYSFIDETSRTLQYSLALIQSDFRAVARSEELTTAISGGIDSLTANAANIESLISSRSVYDQLYVIDNEGRTLYKLEMSGADPVSRIAPPVPNRSSQEFFQQTVNMPEGSIYASDIGLTDIDGIFNDTQRPSLRLSTPLFDAQQQHSGVLVASIDLTNFLQGIDVISADRIGEIWLLDRDGYWLAGPRDEEKWGNSFPARQSINLESQFPSVWREVNTRRRGQSSIDGNILAFVSICADLICREENSDANLANFEFDDYAPDAYWILASYTPRSELGMFDVLLPRYERWLIVFLALMALVTPSVFIVWKLASTLVTLWSKEQELKRSMIMHEAFFERNPTIMFVKDLEGNYYMANKSCRTFANASESLVGTSRHTIFPDEAAVVMDEQDRKVLEYKQPMEFNTKWKGKNGDQYFSTLRFPMLDAEGQVIGIGGIANDITDQIQARKALRESETQFRTLLETAPVAVIIANTSGQISLVNKRAEDLFGYERRDLIAKKLSVLLPEIDLSVFEEMELSDGGGKHTQQLVGLYAHDREGNSTPVEISLSTTITEVGIAVTCLVQDVSDRAQLEAQLRQSQKMEAVGKLTGGMAHDFNNLLGVIIGNLDLAARKLDMDSPGFKRLITAKKAAERGAELTKRMLAVARRQTLQPKPTDINSTIIELTHILPRTMGPDIVMGYDLAEGLPPVLVDPSGLENVLINLAINSRDAMPNGGKFYITTHKWHLSAKDALSTHDEMKPGDYVHVAFTDTGEGMTAQTLSRAFEPFFTTKERGKGTGLGLAMIYGFAKQSGGNVRMFSEIGVGTTIDLFLPIAKDAVAQHDDPTEFYNASRKVTKIAQSETILVVDDEYELLEVAVAYLEEMGFRVLAATNGEQALRTLARNPDIDILLTDIVMPGGMNGVELAAAVREISATIKVLYTSGFPEGVLADKSGAKLDAPLVSKPYTREGLAKAISKLLTETA